MLIYIETESEKPIYQQIRDQVVEGIASGQLREGSGLPTIRQLAEDASINLHTVNKAYEILEREGFIQLRRKTGAVVQLKKKLPEDWVARLRTLLAEAYAQYVPAATILEHCRLILQEFAQEQENNSHRAEMR